MSEELETVLRLVAEGRLTPEEAAPIVDALSRAENAARDAERWNEDLDVDPDLDDVTGLDRLGERIGRRVERQAERVRRHAERAARRVARAEARIGGGRQIRIRVTERGRQVVNLRIPVGFVDTAIRFVPGLGGEQADRIRAAVRSGAVGPIIDVEDPDGQGGVLISVE